MYTDPYTGKIDWGSILGDTGSNFMQMMMLKKLMGGGGASGQTQMPQTPVPQGMPGQIPPDVLKRLLMQIMSQQGGGGQQGPAYPGM